MAGKMNVVIVGYSTFSWELASQLKGQIGGRLYYVLPDWDQAMEASLQGNVIAVRGEITDTSVLDQLDLPNCHTFVSGSRQDQANVLSALYARNKGARHVYARVFEVQFVPLLESLDINPIQASHTAAASLAISILKPAVAELVSLSQGQFGLDEVQSNDIPALIGCRLGNLQGDQLHIVAVSKRGNTFLGYNTLIEPDSTLIVVYDEAIKRRLHQEVQQIAVQTKQRMSERGR